MEHLDKFLPRELTDIIFKQAFDDIIKNIPTHPLAGMNKWNNPSFRLIGSTVEMYGFLQESQDPISTPTYNVFGVIE